MDEILPGLWIADLACALSTEYLSLAGITHIVTAMGQRLPAPGQLPCGRFIPASHLLHVKCDDEESEPIIVHFPRVNELLEEVLAERWVEGSPGGEIDEPRPQDGKWGHWETTGEGTVLVHCQAGCSRSVALVAAYVMATRGLNRDEALELIRSRRSQANPNAGFMEQLDLYERASCQVDLRHAPIRRFLMSKTDVLNGGRVEDLLMSYYPSPAASPTPSSNGSSRGLAWAAMSTLEEGADGAQAAPELLRRLSKFKVPFEVAASSSSTQINLSVSPVMPTNTDELFAKDQAKLRANKRAVAQTKAEQDAENEKSDSTESGERVNDWATSLSSPHEVIVTRSFGSRQPFNVPSTSLRGHESISNQGSIPKPNHLAFEGTTRLRCRICRREIAAKDHVIEHEVGKGKGAFDLRKTRKDERGMRYNEGFVRARRLDSTSSSFVPPNKDENWFLEGPASPLAMEQKFGSQQRRQISANGDEGNDAGPAFSVDSQAAVTDATSTLSSMKKTSADVQLSSTTLDPQRKVPLDDGLAPEKDGISSRKESPAAPILAPTGRLVQSAASLTASLPPHLAALRVGRAPPGARLAQRQSLSESRRRSEAAKPAVQQQGPTRGLSDGAWKGGQTADAFEREAASTGEFDGKSTDSSSTASASTAFPQPALTAAAMKRAGSAAPEPDAAPPLLPSAECTSYFLEPLSWMSLPLDGSTLSGRLLCPNAACRQKLGGWDWAGLQCACGAWVTPGFAVLASRVDEVQGDGVGTSISNEGN